MPYTNEYAYAHKSIFLYSSSYMYFDVYTKSHTPLAQTLQTLSPMHN